VSGDRIENVAAILMTDTLFIIVLLVTIGDEGKGVRRLTPQLSGRAMLHVHWHFIQHAPLQLLVSRLAHGI
jgi:hypothetical protein